MQTLRSLYQLTTKAFGDAGVENPQLDARLLLMHCYGLSHEFFITEQNKLFDGTLFTPFLQRRLKHEPVSKIIGFKEFWSLPFITSADVLDPRPDSETLIESVLARVPDKGADIRILDYGTGSGCLLLSLLHEYKNARGVGVDISEKAINVAAQNAQELGLDDRLTLINGSWDAPLQGEFDVIISNPPYIPTADLHDLRKDVTEFDPMLALDGGDDGLTPYPQILVSINQYLKKSGFFVFEHGVGQETDIANLITDSGLQTLDMTRDLSGRVRCVIGSRAG